MKKLGLAARKVLRDLVKLNLPVTAAATATTIVGVIEPFGVDLSDQTKRITAALAVLGLVISYVQHLVGDDDES